MKSSLNNKFNINNTLLKFLFSFLLGSLGLFSLGSLKAQEYPTKIVKIIAPVAPGGGVDLIARTIADSLTRALGQSFVVENQSGGGGIIASQIVARSAPDGYTLLLSYVGTHGTNPAVRKLPYNAINDFTPIAMVGGTPNVLVVTPNLPVKNFKEFLAYAKTNSNSMTYGSSGPGTLTHLAMEQLKIQANFNSTHAPYRGIGPAIVDTISGQTLSMLPGLAAALPHIKTGKLRAIAVTGSSRHPLLPEIPTFKELGLDGFDGVQWYGISGPAKLPVGVRNKLNAEINKAIQSPELKSRLSAEAITTMPMSPDQFNQYIKDDIARWTRVAKDRNISID